MIDLLTEVAASARADAVRSAVRERAREFGFDAVGFATPDLPRDRQTAYRRFIAEGRHGDMGWVGGPPTQQ
jgi:epoxyqueuosine reductase